MAINFDSALGVHEQAFKLRAQRAAVLANNLANADTPNYKARDIDFRSVMQQEASKNQSFALRVTSDNHIAAQGFGGGDSDLMYRTPNQPSVDGNTVEEQVEHAEYMKNALAFQASYTFLNSKFKGLTSAIRGE